MECAPLKIKCTKNAILESDRGERTEEKNVRAWETASYCCLFAARTNNTNSNYLMLIYRKRDFFDFVRSVGYSSFWWPPSSSERIVSWPCVFGIYTYSCTLYHHFLSLHFDVREVAHRAHTHEIKSNHRLTWALPTEIIPSSTFWLCSSSNRRYIGIAHPRTSSQYTGRPSKESNLSLSRVSTTKNGNKFSLLFTLFFFSFLLVARLRSLPCEPVARKRSKRN